MPDHIPNKLPAQSVQGPIPVERRESLWSTSGEARERVRRGELTGAQVIVAARQTGAYGQRGRTWQAPPGGLWWTLACPWDRIDAGQDGAEALGILTGGACLEAISRALEPARVGRDRITLKWPNDVLIDGRKVCGCLCERVEGGGESKGAWLIVGVGINVNNDPAALIGEMRSPPTSMRAVAGREFALEELEVALTQRMQRALRPRSAPEVRAELSGIADRLHGLGGPIVVQDGGGELIRGVLEGLSDTGRLVVMTGRGRVFVAPRAEVAAPPRAAEADTG